MLAAFTEEADINRCLAAKGLYTACAICRFVGGRSSKPQRESIRYKADQVSNRFVAAVLQEAPTFFFLEQQREGILQMHFDS